MEPSGISQLVTSKKNLLDEGVLPPSKRFLPYVECTASSKMYQFQNDECKEVGVETYPTWKFEDGTYFFGLLKPEDLANKTNCPMPELDTD